MKSLIIMFCLGSITSHFQFTNYFTCNTVESYFLQSINSRLCKLQLSFCAITIHCNMLVDIYSLFLKTITTLEIKFVFSGIYTHIINYSKLYNIPSVLITLMSSIMTMHVLIIIHTAYQGHSVSNHPKKMKFETVPPQILMKIYTFGLYGQKRTFAK